MSREGGEGEMGKKAGKRAKAAPAAEYRFLGVISE
jgi:hypothetical protein